MDPEAVRRDFRVLDDADGRAVAYLDNACTTLKPDAVVDAVAEYYSKYPVCGDRSVHRLGTRVTQAVDASRRALARHTGAQPDDVVFTRNATEAINLVAAATPWKSGDVVITTDKEHNSNFVPWVHLAQTRGIEHRVVATQDDGTWDDEAFAAAVEAAADRLRLVSVVGVSNVDGVAFPTAKIARRTHEAGARLLVDAAQSAAHQHVTLDATGADYMALSLHKMLGPSGVGALAAMPDAWEELGPWQLGGGTVSQSGPDGFQLLERPARYEAGLGNFAGLVAVAPAIDYLSDLGFDAIQQHDRRLNEHATRLLADIPGLTVHGPAAANRTSILPFTVDGLDPHDVALYLDEAADVAVRSGAHCVHSYFARRGMTGTVRASFHAYNTTHDVERMGHALTTLVGSVRPQVRPGREK